MGAVGYLGGDPGKLDADGYVQGDLPAANAAGVLVPVAIGTPGNVLTVNAGQPEFLDYEPGGGGGGGSVSSVFGRTGAVVAASNDYTVAQINGLAAQLAAKAPLASPTFTGTVSGITAAMVGADVVGAAAAAQAASQPLDGDLTTIAGLTATTGNTMLAVGGAWASQTPAQAKTVLSLNNVDNTSDANKPVSTAQQTALNLKANLAGPTFTGTVAAQNMTLAGRQLVTVDSLTDAATIALDASAGNRFRVLLTAAVGATRILGTPTNPVDGQMITIEVIQSATGSNALTFSAAWGFGTDITGVTLSTAANKHDFIGAVYNSTAGLWYVIAFVKGY